MEDTIFILKFLGALVFFFVLASKVGHLLKLDNYTKEHQNYYEENDRK